MTDHMSCVPYRPLGVSALATIGHEPHLVVEQAAAAGFDFVGLRVGTGHRAEGAVLDPRSPAARRLTRALVATGVDLLDIDGIVLDGEVRPDAHRSVFETGAALGARIVTVTSWIEDRVQLADRLRAFAREALDFGLVAAYEPRPGQPISRLGEASLCAREADCLLLPDSVNSALVGERGLDIELISDLAVAGRLGDAKVSGGDGVARVAPGAGAIDLGGFLSGLPLWMPLSVTADPCPKTGLADGLHELYAAARLQVDLHAMTELLLVSPLG